jgi:hypothetical protein
MYNDDELDLNDDINNIDVDDIYDDEDVDDILSDVVKPQKTKRRKRRRSQTLTCYRR